MYNNILFFSTSVLKCDNFNKKLNIRGFSKTTINSFDLYKEGKF